MKKGKLSTFVDKPPPTNPHKLPLYPAESFFYQPFLVMRNCGEPLLSTLKVVTAALYNKTQKKTEHKSLFLATSENVNGSSLLKGTLNLQLHYIKTDSHTFFIGNG